MNWRNLQVFGLSKGVKIIGLFVLLVLTGIFFIKLNADDSKGFEASITGAAVQQLPVEETQGEVPTIEIIEDTTDLTTLTQQEDTTPSEEEKPYYEYQTDVCAAEVKKAQDDINDINSYIQGYDTELTTVTNEKNTTLQQKQSESESLLVQMQELQNKIDTLEQELNSLTTQYDQKITLIQEKKTTAQSNLAAAQTKLTEAQATCE